MSREARVVLAKRALVGDRVIVARQQLERIAWLVRLALETIALGARDAVYTQTLRRGDRYEELWTARYGRFVDRVAGGWVSGEGFEHVGRRKVLFALATPRFTFRIWRNALVLRLLERRGFGWRPGRYEAAGSLLKAEWFDTHVEWASSQTGAADWGAGYDLFVGLPWSRNGAAIVTHDAQGFVTFTEYATEREAQVSFGSLERHYESLIDDEAMDLLEREF